MKKTAYYFCIFVALVGVSLSQLKKPFPQNKKYFASSIKPDNVNLNQMNSITTEFYDKWKAKYLKNDCPNHTDWYYVWSDDVPYLPNIICVSEGIGWGMIITALMAGYDTEAKEIFDGLYNYYKAHPSQSYPNSHLMSWVQVTGCTDAGPDDRNSASDADIDIACGLLMAHSQWGGKDDMEYLIEAYKIISDIILYDVNTKVYNIKLGDAIKLGDSRQNDTRTSDFMPYFFRRILKEYGYDDVISKGYEIIKNVQSQNSSGLLPDFIIDCNYNPKPASANYLESEFDGCFYYNACRVPLRITLDYLHNGSTEAKEIVLKINDFFKNKTGSDPGKIFAGYNLDGKDIKGNDYSDLAFIAPLAVSAMIDSKYQDWLNSLWVMINSIEFEDSQYYGNTLKMLALLIISGNFWPIDLHSEIEESKIQGITFKYDNYNNQVLITLDTEFSMNIRIINLLGQVYIPESINIINISDNNTNVILNPGNLPNGFYFIEISNGNSIQLFFKFLRF